MAVLALVVVVVVAAAVFVAVDAVPVLVLA